MYPYGAIEFTWRLEFVPTASAQSAGVARRATKDAKGTLTQPEAIRWWEDALDDYRMGGSLHDQAAWYEAVNLYVIKAPGAKPELLQTENPSVTKNLAQRHGKGFVTPVIVQPPPTPTPPPSIVPTPSPSPEQAEKSECFIATAAYGTPMAPQINVLRGFRDRVLLPDSFGKRLVGAYYTVSPPLAGLLAKVDPLRAMTRALLQPIIAHLEK